MKAYLGVIFATLVVVYASADSSAEEECKDIKAIAETLRNEGPPSPEQGWVVVKAMPLTTAPPNYVEGENMCTACTYLQSCGAIKMHLKINSEGVVSLNLYSYDKTTNNIAHYEQSVHTLDDKYAIFDGSVSKMRYIYEDPTLNKEVSPIPDLINTTLDHPIAQAALVPKTWSINMTCDKKCVWVAMSQKVLEEEGLAKYEADITNALKDLGLDGMLVNIDTTFPFKFDDSDD